MSSEKSFSRQRQSAIFLGSLRGKKRFIPVSFDKLKEAAKNNISKEAYAYIAGSAGDESTKRDNRSAFEKWKIVPSMLRDVSSPDTTITLFGETYPAPFLLGPDRCIGDGASRCRFGRGKSGSIRRHPFHFFESGFRFYGKVQCGNG